LRELDRRAVEVLGLPEAVLMENAGRGAAEAILGCLRARALAGKCGPQPWRAAILCGPGNNGGDGFVVARQLQREGVSVECFCTSSAGREESAATLNRRVAERLGIALFPLANPDQLEFARSRWNVDVLVDALLGTGSSGAPRGACAAAIEAFEACRGPFKVALDLPSGLDADTGEAAGLCVHASLTVTFAALKPGFERASEFTGAVLVADIGLDPGRALGRRT
jgi:NAD(P)H-hydrate epimerase